MSTSAFTRAVTILAVGFLLLDAVLFALVSRFLWAAVCGVAAVLVIVGWQRYRRIAMDASALLVYGRVERLDGSVSLLATRLRRMRVAAAAPSRDFR